MYSSFHHVHHVHVSSVDENKRVMVADFGLARNMYDSEYYQKKHDRPRPIRWMALESIQRDIYSTKSDVVSFICDDEIVATAHLA